MQIRKKLLTGVLATLCAGVACAEDSGAPSFDITGFVVDGNELLQPEEIDRSVAPFKGSRKNFADVQRALEAIQAAYKTHGYTAVQVLLPEQELEQGVIHIKVIEGRFAKVSAKGNQYHDLENLRYSLPEIAEGRAPHSEHVAAALRVANENPSKRVTVLLRDGEKERDIDATLDVVDDRTQKYFASLDNSGTHATGDYRLSLGYQNANVRNQDQVLTMQFTTSPEKMDQVKIFGIGYRIPLYQRGDMLDLFGGYSNVSSGVIQGDISVSGSGLVLGARYSHFLPRVGENYEHKVIYGADYRAYDNNVISGGVGLVPDITVHPLSVAYAGNWHLPGIETGFSLSVAQNLPGGDKGGGADFQAMRAPATADYRIFRYDLNWMRTWASDWQARFVFQGQMTDDALVPGEQFGAGGASSVRGFNEREVSNDSGYRSTLEAYTPDFGSKLDQTGKANLRVRGLAFFDNATFERNKELPGELARQSISSAGIGVRVSSGGNFSLRADLARVLDGSDTRDSGSSTLHVGASYLF
jgi:hemolysin activation/secretion protein